jgi:hypothetical protein
MVIEFGKATELQLARSTEIDLQLAGLDRKKSAIQTDRANHEVIWNKALADIALEVDKLKGEKNDMGETLVSEK